MVDSPRVEFAQNGDILHCIPGPTLRKPLLGLGFPHNKVLESELQSKTVLQ